MARYFQTRADAMAQTKVHSGIWNLPDASAIYRPEVCLELRGLLAKALSDAQPDALAWQRVAREADLWRESEDALGSLPKLTLHAVDAREYNGGVWFTDQEQVTGATIRDLVGIGVGEKLLVVIGEQRLPLEDQGVYDARGGLRLVPSGR